MNSFRREFINFQINNNILKLIGIVKDSGDLNNLKLITKIKFTNNIDNIISINKDLNGREQVKSYLKNSSLK